MIHPHNFRTKYNCPLEQLFRFYLFCFFLHSLVIIVIVMSMDNYFMYLVPLPLFGDNVKLILFEPT